jgi:hypothetical protein
MGSSESNMTMRLLDYSNMAEVHHFPKTKDGIHYMCIWTPKYPDVVKMQKYNANNCEDPMGLAVVQWLANLIVVHQSTNNRLPAMRA